jgi:amino acid transporter
MLGANNGGMLNMPRVLFAASRDGVIPPASLSNIHSRYTTLHIAIIVYATVAFLLASIGGFQALAIVSSAAFLLVYLGVVLAVIKLRKIVPAHSESFRIPGGYTVPVAASIAILWFLSHLTGSEAIGVMILIGVFTIVFFGKHYVDGRLAEDIREKESISEFK